MLVIISSGTEEVANGIRNILSGVVDDVTARELEVEEERGRDGVEVTDEGRKVVWMAAESLVCGENDRR